MLELTKKIKNKAYELGFEKIGIAKPDFFSKDSERLNKWLSLGYHGKMGWMKKRVDERENIYNYFPEARSIISLGLNYFHGKSTNEYKISNYAWGKDYHEVIKKKLIKLVDFINTNKKNVKSLMCVDTAPIMEKSWAQKAGIGWIGKNTNLITRDYGSWIFLAEIILDVDLIFDPIFEDDLCGSCTACIDHCPTNAIVDEYVLDSRKCISYLTIEHRGDLPLEYKGNLDSWIYGCDVCQEVCPWNKKFSQKSNEDDFKPNSEIIKKKKKDWKNLTHNEYKKIFKGSPVKRTKYIGLKRNISNNL
tara:strand:+ start:2668 stop:3579 length:912 start_codon:yes stop_codon:yes gene_type:complete